VHPLQRMHAPLLAIVLAAATGAGQGQALPILDTGTWMCPGATLPLRVAALQPPGNDAIDPAAWIAQDEFRTAQAQLALRRSDPPITLVVLAYLAGDPVEIEVSLTPFGAPHPTWRAELTPDVPATARGSMHLWPYYLFVEVPRHAWAQAFPRPGPYRLEARPARDPSGPFVEGFCASESVSWVFVVGR
jgi:hypothetical protein